VPTDFSEKTTGESSMGGLRSLCCSLTMPGLQEKTQKKGVSQTAHQQEKKRQGKAFARKSGRRQHPFVCSDNGRLKEGNPKGDGKKDKSDNSLANYVRKRLRKQKGKKGGPILSMDRCEGVIQRIVRRGKKGPCHRTGRFREL